eukprot:5349413-Amphidinium_carterae.1
MVLGKARPPRPCISIRAETCSGSITSNPPHNHPELLSALELSCCDGHWCCRLCQRWASRVHCEDCQDVSQSTLATR